MADRFEDLRTFTTVISCGGINAAAAELGIAKSAVSRRISDLEKRLGATLIERSTRHFEPTAVGAEYAKRAQLVLSSLNELDGSIGAVDVVESLTIAAPGAMIRHLLLPAIGRTVSALGQTKVRLTAVGHGVGGTGADVLVADEGAASGESRELLSSTLVICASPQYLTERGVPEEFGVLDGHVAIAVGDAGRSEWRIGTGKRRHPPAAIVAPDEDAAASAAIAGLGLAQLPDYVVAEAVADGRLMLVLEAQQPPPVLIRAFYDARAGLNARRIVDALAAALE